MWCRQCGVQGCTAGESALAGGHSAGGDQQYPVGGGDHALPHLRHAWHDCSLNRGLHPCTAVLLTPSCTQLTYVCEVRSCLCHTADAADSHSASKRLVAACQRHQTSCILQIKWECAAALLTSAAGVSALMLLVNDNVTFQLAS